MQNRPEAPVICAQKNVNVFVQSPKNQENQKNFQKTCPNFVFILYRIEKQKAESCGQLTPRRKDDTIALPNQKAGMKMIGFYLSVIDTETDKSEFSELYDRHETQLRKCALRYANGNIHDAEELLQECWMFVAKKIHMLHFKNEKAERVYLYAVLKNRAKNYWHRSQARNAHETLCNMEEDSFLSDADVEEHICNVDTEERAYQIAQAMSLNDQEIILLVMYMGYSIKDAAKVLNIHPGTAQKRLVRAKIRLAKKLREAGVIDV